MKVAITGATGFLGKSLALRLSEEGHELYLHARSESKAETIKDLAKKLVICDITWEIESLKCSLRTRPPSSDRLTRLR